MIIQYLLSFGLLLVLGYVWLQREKSRVIALIVYPIIGAGLYLVWFPGHANALAAFVGVGRGADLIFYCWVVLSLLLAFNIRMKFRRLEREITKVARHVAIANARMPGK